MNHTSLEVTRNMAKALGRTQYYTPDRMQAYQRKLLEPLLHHARKEVPFYATRLDLLFADDGSIRWDAWGDVPTFTRAEAQEAGNALFAKTAPDHVGGYTEGQTSGSSGTPLKFRVSATSGVINAAAAQRIFEWHDVDFSGKMALIIDLTGRFPFPRGATGRKWNVANPNAPACQLSLSANVSMQLDWLLASEPDIFVTYPSNATAICELAEQRGTPVPFHTFVSQGEVFNEDSKNYLMKVHGLKLIDRYGTSETGAIAAQCPTSNRFHQFSEANLMEVLDFGRNDLVKEGRGRMVLTPFYNYAMPLIRYENQDQVEITQTPCACGRSLPTLERVLGRQKNTFTYIDGTRSWPFLLRHEYAPFLPARQLQTIQKTKTDIEIRFVRDISNTTPIDRKGLQAFLRKRLHPSIQLEIVETQSISRAASGKYEEWVSLATQI
ncbi:phenylacetate--CoA ligase family protein [Pararhizobium sp. IMCC21322]|uniref:phenylacetate--CoA ligase family protein n=1 Tax=Pararhizobium sp. IMCC21322 TaxID=3067903 RepID=UPI002742213E|nr:hypothetical protein [Pararhizobium sp. IMCC21322]